MTALPVLMVVLVCSLFLYRIETTTGEITDEVQINCTKVYATQEAVAQYIIDVNVTNASVSRLLYTLGKGVERNIRWPADNAIDSMWGYMRTNHALNASWTGETERQRSMLRHRAEMEIPRLCSNYAQDGAFIRPSSSMTPSAALLDAVYVTFREGQMAGVSINRSINRQTLQPRVPVVSRTLPARRASTSEVCREQNCDASAILDHDAENYSNDSRTDEETGLDEQMAIQANFARRGEDNSTGTAPSMAAWSEVYTTSREGEGSMKIAKTYPVSYCGDYSCFQGVIAAEITLQRPGRPCNTLWKPLEDFLLEEGLKKSFEEKNGRVFLVNHVSNNFPDQQGLLLSTLHDFTVGVQADASDDSHIANASQVILHKFQTWDDTSLQQPQFFNVSAHSFQQGLFSDCESGTIEANDCILIGTKSIVLDNDTRWLAVVSLPSSVFNADLLQTNQAVKQEVEDTQAQILDEVQTIRITLACITLGVTAASVFVGLGFGWVASEPLQSLSGLMQLLAGLQFVRQSEKFRPLRSGRRSRIKEIKILEDTFCQSLRAIEDFARFVPQMVVKNIVDNQQRATKLHVHRKEVTTMFCTIKDFAPIVIKNPAFATKCYAVMTQIAETYRGTVPEILSDGILVYWNSVEKTEHHKAWACAAALSIKRAIEELNTKVNGTDAAPLKMQIGIHSGMVRSGVIGSDIFFKWGCVGDAVNLASRIGGLCNIFGASIVASSETMEDLVKNGVFFTRRLGRITVKGRKKPTEVHELLGLNSLSTRDATLSPRFEFAEEPVTPHNDWERSTPGRTPRITWNSGLSPTISAARRGVCFPCARAAAGPPVRLPAASPGVPSPGPAQAPSAHSAPPVLHSREQRTGPLSPASNEDADRSEDVVSTALRELASEYEEALKAYEMKDFESARTIASKLSDQGDVPATCLLERIKEVTDLVAKHPEEEDKMHCPLDWPMAKKK
jgi:class 3 adenylate cyclase